MGEIFKISAEKGYRHYFYGSTEETLELLYKKLNENYPGIQIAGMYSPPFRPMTEEEDKAMVERINEVNPDLYGLPWRSETGKVDGRTSWEGQWFDDRRRSRI